MGRIDRCLNCQERKEILARNMCAMCYRRDERRRKRQPKPQSGLSSKHIRLMKTRHALLVALYGSNATQEQVRRVLQILAPQFAPLRFMEHNAVGVHLFG